MSDERIVEVMAKAPWWTSGDDDMAVVAKHAAEDMLAALRGAGFDVYRPDDCDEMEVHGFGYLDNELFGVDQKGNPWAELPTGTYRLVPVGGDS